MTDPYAEVRAGLQQAVADVAGFVMERYRGRIDMANANHAPERAFELHRQMQEDIDRLTAPAAKLLATLPPPPVLITMEGGKIVRIEHG